MKYFVALDVGTSSVKAALFDLHGRPVGSGLQEYELQTTGSDIVELDPETYWTASQAAIALAVKSSGIEIGDVGSMGVTSQGETLIVLDADGRPLRKAIVWLDNRAGQEAREIAEAFDFEEVYRRTGQHEIVPGWTAPKILWIRKNEPQVFRKAARFLLVEDYIIYRLTGRYVSDHAINPSTLYYDLTNGDWWDGMLDFLGITRSCLPRLQHSGENAGTVIADIGLSPNTVVTSTPMDQVTGAVGVGNVAPGVVSESTGSALAICASSGEPLYDPHARVSLYRHARPDSYVLLPWVPTAGMILRWFRDELGGGQSYSQLAGEAQTVPRGAEGLFVLPHFSGALSPRLNPAAKGVFHGLSLGHTRGHIVRAIMEAVAFILKDNLDMLESLGVKSETVCSFGGAAQNDFWLQIKADVLNREIVTPEVQEATCLGAAVLAAVGGGTYASLEEAVTQMVRFRNSYRPDKEAVEVYARSYRRYQELDATILPTFGGDL